MDFKKEIEQLHLTPDSYMIVGSGILNALEIRHSNDIDILVSKESFSTLVHRGWKILKRKDGTLKITCGLLDCMTDWYGKSLRRMLKNATYIDTIPYMSLDSVYEWKKKIGRPKDIVDLQLIEEYQSKL